MNYVLETLNFHLDIDKEFNNVLIEQMQYESEYIMAVMDSMIIVTEAAETTTVDGKKVGIFARIKEFLSKILKFFTDKLKTISEKNKDWLEANKQVLEKLNYDGLQIEMFPFWTVDFKAKAGEVRSQVTRVLNASNSSQHKLEFKELENVKKDLFGIYLDENNDLSNGAKNYFRVGKPMSKDARPISLGGDDLKKQILSNFYPYCLNYAQETLSEVKVVVDVSINQLTRIEQAFNSIPQGQGVKESFYAIENAYFSDTSLRYATNLIVLEAEQPAATNTTLKDNTKPAPDAPKTDAKPASPTAVTLHNSSNNAVNTAASNVSQMSTDDALVVKNIAQCVQTVASALMTVAEERYMAYINAMKQVVSARKSTVSAENTATTTETKNTVAPKAK